jgi:hypothetical protein
MMKKIYTMIAMMAMTLTVSAQSEEVKTPWDDSPVVEIVVTDGKFTLTTRKQDQLTIDIPKQVRTKKGDYVLAKDGKRLVYAIVTDAKNPLNPEVVLLNTEYEDNENGTPKVEKQQLEPGTFIVVKSVPGVWAPGARIAVKGRRWQMGKFVAEQDGKVLMLMNGSTPQVGIYPKADIKLLPLKEMLKPGEEVTMNRANMASLCMDGWKVKKVNAAIGRVWIAFGPSETIKIMSIPDVSKLLK